MTELTVHPRWSDPPRCEPEAGQRPNIVLVLVDDLGWSDLGCYGSSFHETPNIDRLAASGVRFTDAYAAAPVCSPSRAALMSGKYPARVGVTNFIGGHAVGALADVPYFYGLPQNEYSLARALGEGGYDTWHVGKWHLGARSMSPEAHGFAVNIGGGALGSPATHFSPYGIANLSDGPVGEYLTDRLTSEAVRLIEQHDSSRPFFLDLSHYTVHTPIEAPGSLVAKYQVKAARLGLDTRPLEEGEAMPTWHLAGRRVQRRTVQSEPTYAAMVETLDDSVGAVVAALRATGQLGNTVIVFTSDNGGLATAEGSPTCNAPLAEGKGWMEDGGVRVPLLISWPGRIDAATSRCLTITPDLYPTLLGLAGLEPRAGQAPDGVDIGPALHGAGFDRGPIFWHYPHYSNQGGTPGAAVREGRWKLITWFETGRQALFDLQTDLSESHDRAAEEPVIRRRLADALEDWSSGVGAVRPARNAAWSAPRPPAATLLSTSTPRVSGAPGRVGRQ